LAGFRICFIASILFGFLSPFALAAKKDVALIEISVMGSYGRSQFKVQGGDYLSIQRRYTGSIEFKFTPVSSFQFEYTDSYTKNSAPTNVGVVVTKYTTESMTYADKIYSFNWVQNLVPSTWIFQPYIKVGGGRVYRVQKLEYLEFGETYTVAQRLTTGVGGAGFRLFLTSTMAIKGEFTTYVPDFKFSRWRETEMFSAGLSWLF
jgi:hypothetical protein